MKTNKFILRGLLVGVLLTFSVSSCKKDFYDINQNPNAPANVDVTFLLPSAEAAVGNVVGDVFQVYGGLYSQYWTQTTSASQYKNLEQYSPSADFNDRPWKALYADALKDLQIIVDKSVADKNKPNYVAVAKILQGYTYQLLTDNFGDVPFSEALQAPDITSPKYDPQQQVYAGIVKLIKDGLDSIDYNSTEFTPGADDLLLGGDMEQWNKFGNTLLLRVYLRMAYVDPAAAQQGIMALQDSGAVFLAEGENVQINYLAQGGNTNPMYAEEQGLQGTQNLVASATVINYMDSTNDPRIDVLYDPSSLGQTGLLQGSYDAPVNTPVSTPSAFTGASANDAASATAPVKFMSSYESLFLQAEAAARGWLTANGDPQALYEEGITESFVSLGFTDSDAITYFTQPSIAYPSGGSVEDQVKAIITQKWVAMAETQGDEAWIEWRRTGYPDFFTVSVNSLIGHAFPQVLPYPSTEVTQNGSFPGQHQITDRVWWDVANNY